MKTNHKILSARQIAALIRRNNLKFKRATAAQKRVLVAEDVLKRIDTKQMRPRRGDWVQSSTLSEQNPQEQLQPLIVGGATCTVCALGGLAISCIAMQNHATGRAMDRNNGALRNIGYRIQQGFSIPGGLDRLFSKKQIALIEFTFEKGSGAFQRYDDAILNDSNARDRSWMFACTHRTDHARLKAIMQNIVKNNGTFKP